MVVEGSRGFQRYKESGFFSSLVRIHGRNGSVRYGVKIQAEQSIQGVLFAYTEHCNCSEIKHWKGTDYTVTKATRLWRQHAYLIHKGVGKLAEYIDHL